MCIVSAVGLAISQGPSRLDCSPTEQPPACRVNQEVGRTGDALLEIGVCDKGAVEAGADAKLAENLVLPDVRHVVLAQRVQRRPHVQLQNGFSQVIN